VLRHPNGSKFENDGKQDQVFEVLTQSHNMVETLQDASAHAEILALRCASRILKNWRLYNTTLYSTLEPCAMCLASCQAFRVSEIVYGAPDLRLGAVESYFSLLEMQKPHPYHPRMNIFGGVLADRSRKLITSFFVGRRKRAAQVFDWDRGCDFDKSNYVEKIRFDTPLSVSKLLTKLKDNQLRKPEIKLQNPMHLDIRKETGTSSESGVDDLEYRGILEELATAERNVLEAERELRDLELKEIRAEKQQEEQSMKNIKQEERSMNILKQEERELLELDAPPSPRKSFSLGPLNKRASKWAESSESSLADADGNRDSSPGFSLRTNESDIVRLSSKDLLERHIRDNTEIEMKRIEKDGFVKAENDIMRIMGDLEHLKKLAGVEARTNPVAEGSPSRFETYNNQVEMDLESRKRFQKVDFSLDPRTDLEQRTILDDVQPSILSLSYSRSFELDPLELKLDAPDDGSKLAFPVKLSRRDQVEGPAKPVVEDPDARNASLRQTVLERLRMSFWKGKDAVYLSDRDSRLNSRIEELRQSGKKLDFLFEADGDQEYHKSILEMDLDLDIIETGDQLPER